MTVITAEQTELKAQVKNGAYCITDAKLKELGELLVKAYEEEREITRQYNAIKGRILTLESQRQARLAEIEKTTPRLHTLPRVKKPTADQQKALDTFALVLAGTNLTMLEGVYNLVKQTKAHETSWTTEQGENVDVAFRRRKQELAAI